MSNVIARSFGQPLFMRERLGWLERQALRIVAETNGASFVYVRRTLVTFYVERDVHPDIAVSEAERCLDYLKARVFQIRALQAMSPFSDIMPPASSGRQA